MVGAFTDGNSILDAAVHQASITVCIKELGPTNPLYTRLMGRAWIAVVIALAGAGCGGGSLPTEAAMTDFATTPGRTVLTPAVRTVILTSSGGGFHRSPPAGAACDPSHWSYLLSP